MPYVTNADASRVHIAPPTKYPISMDFMHQPERLPRTRPPNCHFHSSMTPLFSAQFVYPPAIQLTPFFFFLFVFTDDRDGFCIVLLLFD